MWRRAPPYGPLWLGKDFNLQAGNHDYGVQGDVGFFFTKFCTCAMKRPKLMQVTEGQIIRQFLLNRYQQLKRYLHLPASHYFLLFNQKQCWTDSEFNGNRKHCILFKNNVQQ